MHDVAHMHVDTHQSAIIADSNARVVICVLAHETRDLLPRNLTAHLQQQQHRAGVSLHVCVCESVMERKEGWCGNLLWKTEMWWKWKDNCANTVS